MSEYNLCEPKSAYKTNHSVETARVCVQNDILHAMDNQNIVIVLLLDLSAAFDTVDHSVMLHRLSHDVGVVETALHWFKSYLSDRVQYIHINGCTSLSTLMVSRHLLALLRSKFCTRSAVVLYICSTIIENYLEQQLDVTFLCR